MYRIKRKRKMRSTCIVVWKRTIYNIVTDSMYMQRIISILNNYEHIITNIFINMYCNDLCLLM